MVLSKNTMKRLFIFITLVFIAILGNVRVVMAENQFCIEEGSNNISYNSNTVNREEHFNKEDYEYIIEACIRNIEISLEKSESILETVETITETIELSIETIENNTEAVKSNVGASENNAEAIESNVGISENNAGAIESNVGISENNVGEIESNVGISENNAEAVESNVGINEKNVEAVEFNVGASENNTEAVESNVGTSEKNVETVEPNMKIIEIGTGIVRTNVETIENNLEAVNKKLDDALEKVGNHFKGYEKSIIDEEEIHKDIYNFANIRSTMVSIENRTGMLKIALVNKVTEPKISFNHNMVKSFGNIENNYIKQAENVIMCIPNKLVENFIENGWDIYITDEDINQVHFKGKYDRVKGMTSYKNKFIKIENKDDAIKDGVFHEFGHYVDYINEFPSKSEEFKQIYKEEVNVFKSQTKNPIAVSNEGEFFAEIFHYMLEDPSICTTKASQYVKAQLNMFLR